MGAFFVLWFLALLESLTSRIMFYFDHEGGNIIILRAGTSLNIL